MAVRLDMEDSELEEDPPPEDFQDFDKDYDEVTVPDDCDESEPPPPTTSTGPAPRWRRTKELAVSLTTSSPAVPFASIDFFTNGTYLDGNSQ